MAANRGQLQGGAGTGRSGLRPPANPGAGRQHGGKILPTAGRDNCGPVHIVLDAVKMLGAQFQVSLHSGVQAMSAGILCQTARFGSISMRRTRSSVTRSKSRTLLLYSGGLPAATITPAGGHPAWLPKVLHCKNCSMVGASVPDTQLISSINKIPCSGRSAPSCRYTLPNDLALIVLRYALRSAPPRVRWRINGPAPGALAGVVGDGVCHQRNAAFLRLLHDLGLPTPGGPISRIGRWRMGGISGVPVSSTAR